jgi:uncharacterized protein (DUF302 family)
MKTQFKRMLLPVLAVFSMTISSAFAETINYVRVFTTDNSMGKITPQTIQETFEKAGFMIEANNDMLVPFKREFKGVVYHDVYNLMVVWKKDFPEQVVQTYPKVGLLTPMSMSVYTMKGSKTISVSSLTPEAMTQIMGVDEEGKEKVQKLAADIENVLRTALPGGKFETLPYVDQKMTNSLIAEWSFDVNPDKWESRKDELEMNFDSELATKGFVSPSFLDLNYFLQEKEIEDYLFYDIISICKIPVIYQVSQTHPEAGAFGPCSMYFYMKEGDTQAHLGFPNVYNWINALQIKDQTSIDVLVDAQTKLESSLTKLTGTPIK